MSVFGIFMTILMALGVIKVMQKKTPTYLPEMLQTWKFLPEPLRSLRPYDSFITKYLCFMSCCKKLNIEQSDKVTQKGEVQIQANGLIHSNKAFENDVV